MSGSLNKVILIGNIGKDPELKMTPQGQALARFSVATSDTWRDAQGHKQSKTEWHNVVVWGKQAEIAEKYLTKGKQVMVEGRIQYREYTTAEGQKRTATDIKCDSFVMLGSRDAPTAPPASGDSTPAPSGYDDDIPF